MKYDAHKKEATKKWLAKQRKAGVAVPEAARRPAKNADADADADGERSRYARRPLAPNGFRFAPGGGGSGSASDSDSGSDGAADIDAQTAALRELIAAANTGLDAAPFVPADAAAENAQLRAESDAAFARLMALDAAVLDAALGTLPLRVRLPLNADLFEDDAKTLEALLSSEQEPLPEKKPASTTPTPTPEYAKLLKTKNVSAQINILPTSSPSSPSEEHNRNTASSILQSSTSSVLPAPSKQHSRKKSPSPSRPPPPIKSKQSGPKKAIEPEDDELDLLLSSDPLPSKSAKSIKMDKPGKQPGKQPTKSAPAKKDESDDLKFLDDLLQ